MFIPLHIFSVLHVHLICLITSVSIPLCASLRMHYLFVMQPRINNSKDHAQNIKPGPVPVGPTYIFLQPSETTAASTWMQTWLHATCCIVVSYKLDHNFARIIVAFGWTTIVSLLILLPPSPSSKWLMIVDTINKENYLLGWIRAYPWQWYP